MNKYIELTIIQSAELPSHVVMSAVFEQIHQSLVAMKTNRVGLSFPAATNTHIGNKIRLHGVETELTGLMSLGRLDQFDGYLEKTDLLTVPVDTKFRIIRRKRIQTRVSPSQIKRYMKRHNVSEIEAKEFFGNKEMQVSGRFPYLTVQSQSSGGLLFNLCIDQGTETSEPLPGEFNAYGLSSTATVPWF